MKNYVGTVNQFKNDMLKYLSMHPFKDFHVDFGIGIKNRELAPLP